MWKSLFHIKNVKLAGKINSPTRTKTSSTKLAGWATFLFANWITTLVGCRGPRERDLKIDRGITFIEAPRSSIAFSNLFLPMMQGTQNILGSLHFSGIKGTNLPINADTFLPMLILSFFFSLLLCVHNSFKNFAYMGICLMASNRGMFISTFLNVSKISLSTSSIFFIGMPLWGNGRGMEGAAVEVEDVGVTLDVEGPAAWASRFL